MIYFRHWHKINNKHSYLLFCYRLLQLLQSKGMRKTMVRSQAKIKLTLEQKIAAIKFDQLPPISAREFLPSKTLISSIRQSKNMLSSPAIQRSKKHLILIKEVNPKDRPESGSSSSQGSHIMKRLDSGRQQKVLPQLTVLKVNHDKKSKLKNPFIRQSLVGEEAVNKFYQRYKNLDRRKQQQDFMNQKHALTNIVSLLQMHNFTPRKLTVVKLKGEEAILDLRKLGIGQGTMGPVVTQIMNSMDKFQQVDLSYNRIDVLLGQALIQKLAKSKRVDLSHNRIGKIGCQKFSELFLSPYTRIEQLNLQQNNLLDNAGAILIEHLYKYNNLRKLNLNKNYMGIKFAQALKEIIDNDRTLSELYLSWNQFNSKAVKAIFQGIRENTYLRVFDFSWNKIQDSNIQLLAEIFNQVDSLIHADFSFCEIRLKSVAALSKALNSNHTLFGLHFQGNSGYIDHKGFLIQTDKQFSQYPLPIIRGVIRRIDGVKPQSNNEFKGGNMRDVCWICHSWQQRYFEIEYNQQMRRMARNSSNAQCFIHFKHENYNGVKMWLSDSGDRYEINRMCPLGNIQFFFTFSCGVSNKKRFVSSEYQKIYQQQSVHYYIGKVEFNETLQYRNNQNCQYYTDPIEENYTPYIEIAPRTPEVRMGIKQGQKVIVKKKRTVYRNQKVKVNLKDVDNEDDDFLKDKLNRDGDEEYLKRCIEFDIANSKLAKVIKDPADLFKFKNTMLQFYRHFKDAFYYLSHANPSMLNIFSISELQFTAFLQQQKYITKRVNQAKIMLKLYACLSANQEELINKKDKKVDDKANNKLISRPQFLQFLVRLAIQKWCYNPHKKRPKVNKELLWEQEDLKMLKTKRIPDKLKESPQKKPQAVKPQPKQQKQQEVIQSDEEEQQQQKKLKIQLPLSFIAGLERTMTTLIRYAQNYRSSNWRKKKYLKIDILIVIKAYEQFLNLLFDKCTQSKFKTNKPKKITNLLTLQELRNLMIDTDIRKTKEAMKEVDQAFLDSKRLQVEDGNIQFGLNFQEFLQCLCRICENVWFNPPAAPNAQMWQSQINRKNTPTFLKFQSLIVALYWRTPDLHNRRMTKICEKGIFEVEISLIMEKIQALSRNTGSFGLVRKNSIYDEQEISLKEITEELREKFDKMIVQKAVQQEYLVQQQIFQQ